MRCSAIPPRGYTFSTRGYAFSISVESWVREGQPYQHIAILIVFILQMKALALCMNSSWPNQTASYNQQSICYFELKCVVNVPQLPSSVATQEKSPIKESSHTSRSIMTTSNTATDDVTDMTVIHDVIYNYERKDGFIIGKLINNAAEKSLHVRAILLYVSRHHFWGTFVPYIILACGEIVFTAQKLLQDMSVIKTKHLRCERITYHPGVLRSAVKHHVSGFFRVPY